MNLTDLTTLAMLGTERQELPRADAGTPADLLQAQLNPEQRESALLSAASIAAVYERVGRLPAQDLSPLPLASAAETLSRVSIRSSTILTRMLSGEFSLLMREWLERADRLRLLASPESLPALLTLGTETQSLRAAVLTVIGERGRWLALQNPEWAWVAGGDEGEDVWHTGDTRARTLLLGRLRQSDPGRARNLVEASWKDEAPDDRATFLGLFHTGLSIDDEAFLETALDDKRKEVRRTAAALLGRLPTSARATRMLERARPLLRFAGDTIEVTLPQACDKAMQRDGIELKPAQGMGEKAAWLIQFLEGAPLDHWPKEFHANPDRIVAASLAGEWKAELLEAWTRAAIRQSNATWSEAVLDASVGQEPPHRVQELLGTLSPSRQEERLTQWLADGQLAERHVALVTPPTHNWSLAYSKTVLNWLRTLTSQPSTNWFFRTDMKSIAPQLHPDILPEVARNWPEDSVGWEFWSKGVEELQRVAQFRHELLTA